jgi:hypothetical protein
LKHPAGNLYTDAANPAFVFDEVAISTLRSKGITLEPAFSGFGNRWIDRP